MTFDLDLDLEHTLDAGPCGDHHVQVWWRSTICGRSSDLRKKVYRQDGQTDRQTDGRRTPRDCISSWNSWARTQQKTSVLGKPDADLFIARTDRHATPASQSDSTQLKAGNELKTNLDSSDLNSYRPIFNLSFVSKLLERIIDSRITEHADLNKLFSPVQSAYRKHHSTETALVRIHNDLVTSIDQGHVGALVLLDMSAAFDTVDHHLLLRTLEYRFSVSDSALAWFNSYLSDRTQTVQRLHLQDC